MEYIILIVVLAVLLVGGLGSTFLLRSRGGRRVSRGSADSVTGGGTATAPERTQAPGAAEGGGTATIPAPPAPVVPAQPEAPAKPAIEKPPPSAGRMVRLRARLARSQSGFGSALLSLLSRERLDDDTWDEIEEVLITPAVQGEGRGHADPG